MSRAMGWKPEGPGLGNPVFGISEARRATARSGAAGRAQAIRERPINN